MSSTKTSLMSCIKCLYMDSLCSHHAEIQYLHLIYTVYNVIILPFHSCKKKRAPFTALFHIDFLIHLSYSTVLQPMSLNFFPKWDKIWYCTKCHPNYYHSTTFSCRFQCKSITQNTCQNKYN